MTSTTETASTTPDPSAHTREVVVSAEQRSREDALVQTVLDSFSGTPSPRLHQVMTSLVTHLHAFAREVRLTEEEWNTAIEFLTAVGHITDDKRQEFILLSDVLGLSMQTITMNNEAVGHATEATVFGPFFLDDAPRIEHGGDMSFGAKGTPLFVDGTITDLDGNPIPDARIEVWECDEDGLYDVQYTDDRTACRAHLFSDSDGSYHFWGLKPVPYPIPADGPVGALLAATNRSPMRASHLHVMVSAPGFHTLVTHAFIKGDDYVTRDSVFGVKDSLIMDFADQPAGTTAPDGTTPSVDWSHLHFDVILPPEKDAIDTTAAVTVREAH